MCSRRCVLWDVQYVKLRDQVDGDIAINGHICEICVGKGGLIVCFMPVHVVESQLIMILRSRQDETCPSMRYYHKSVYTAQVKNN